MNRQMEGGRVEKRGGGGGGGDDSTIYIFPFVGDGSVTFVMVLWCWCPGVVMSDASLHPPSKHVHPIASSSPLHCSLALFCVSSH